MPDTSTRDVVVSFADLVANYVLPGPGGKLVSTLLPKIVDMVLPASAIAAYAQAGGNNGITQDIVLQDGTVLAINISRSENRGAHAALMQAHSDISAVDSGSSLSRTQQYFPLDASPSSATAGSGQNGQLGGGVSILNGIIGVNW